MLSCRRFFITALSVIPVVAAPTAAAPTNPPATQPTPPAEATSDLADLWRERDAFYLRLDGRLPKEPGIAPPGTREMAIRIDSATRGREFPGRYTVIEIELMSAASEPIEAGFANGPTLRGTLPPGKWSSVRLPVPQDRADLVVRSPTGLSAKLEFRRVRLIDDRWTLWTDNQGAGWKAERIAGVLTFTRPGQPTMALTDWKVEEVNALRARLTKGNASAVIYASGRVSSSSSELPSTGGEARIKITIGEDFGRLDRTTEGDTNGDGYNEARAATMVRLTERRASFSVSSPGSPSTRPALELLGLPDGDVSVIWEGKKLTSLTRLEDGRVLVEFPGEVRNEARVEVSVGSPEITKGNR